ncbi:hypothetical protein U0070_022503, partial [Myodes glareolus]
WDCLSFAQRALYREVVLENDSNMVSVGETFFFPDSFFIIIVSYKYVLHKDGKHYISNQNDERQNNNMKYEYDNRCSCLTRHKRINLKEKAYICKDFGKSLTRLAKHQAHQRIHTEFILVKNHINVHNVASHLSSPQIFTDIAESILVRNLTDVKNVASPLSMYQLFIIITESILVKNLTDVKNVASPLPMYQLFIIVTESILEEYSE